MSKDRSRSPRRRQRSPSPRGRHADGKSHDSGRSCDARGDWHRQRHSFDADRRNEDRPRHSDRGVLDHARDDDKGANLKDHVRHFEGKTTALVTRASDHPSLNDMKELRLLQPMLEKASRWLIRALRHQPQMLNLPQRPLHLEEGGWAPIGHVLEALARNNYPVNLVGLDWIVRSSNKQRFGVSSDGLKIRANQGHSVNVDMKFVGVRPPRILWHGTAIQSCPAIRAAGLSKMTRQHVHMSEDAATAAQVGARHGQVVVLKIDAALMHADGLLFYCSENGVWLTDHVPQRYITGFP